MEGVGGGFVNKDGEKGRGDQVANPFHPVMVKSKSYQNFFEEAPIHLIIGFRQVNF